MDENRKIAIEWIRNNPHVAFYYAVVAHERQWYGCTNCALNTVASEIDAKTMDEWRENLEQNR